MTQKSDRLYAKRSCIDFDAPTGSGDMLWYLFPAHGTHLFLFYSPKAYHSRKGHVHDYSVKQEKFSVKQEIWLFFILRLRNGRSGHKYRNSSNPPNIMIVGAQIRNESKDLRIIIVPNSNMVRRSFDSTAVRLG